MIKFFVFASILSLFYPQISNSTLQDGVLLIMNMENQKALPKNFRKTNDPFPQGLAKIPSTIGFRELNASASGQFSEKSLLEVLRVIDKKRVLIVDLRQESHGFLDGTAISWMGDRDWANVGKNLEQIQKDENQRLEQIALLGYATVYDGDNPVPMYPKKIENEEKLAQNLHLDYVRLPVTDHCRPTDAAVDFFIEMVKSLPEDTWVHFHCSAGRGRSTSFIVMYDMLRNAHQVSFEDILLRHNLIGGMDLLAPPAKDLWKYSYLVERQEFLKEFYRYSKEAGLEGVSWTDWIKARSLY